MVMKKNKQIDIDSIQFVRISSMSQVFFFLGIRISFTLIYLFLI